MFEINLLTVKQLTKILKSHKYVLLRDSDNTVIGVNSRSLNFKANQGFSPKAKTRFISYKPCSFQNYITHKVPFQ